MIKPFKAECRPMSADNPDTVAEWTGIRQIPAAVRAELDHHRDVREIERQAGQRVFGRRPNSTKGT